MTEIQALVHDVFGTVVDWRSAVTADGEALAHGAASPVSIGSNSPMNGAAPTRRR